MATTAAPQPARQHEALRLLVSGSLIALQPAGATGGKVETLSVDLVSGDVKVTQQPALTGGAVEEVLAVIGALRLRGGTALAVVTRARRVAALYGRPVFEVAATRVLTPRGAAFDSGDQRCAALALGAGKGTFFSALQRIITPVPMRVY